MKRASKEGALLKPFRTGRTTKQDFFPPKASTPLESWNPPFSFVARQNSNFEGFNSVLRLLDLTRFDSVRPGLREVKRGAGTDHPEVSHGGLPSRLSLASSAIFRHLRYFHPKSQALKSGGKWILHSILTLPNALSSSL